jgi:endonuclease-3
MQDDFGGDLSSVLRLELAKARRALCRFPAIGEPGAEKILLFTRAHPVLALDSSGLRVLVRLGYGVERKSYAATYREVQASAAAELPHDCEALVRAHLLLRLHGKELCRTTRPACDGCPLRDVCAHVVGAAESAAARAARHRRA